MLEAARAIMLHLRARDAAELAECGFDREAAAHAFAAPAVLARVFEHEGRPVAIVAFHRLTPKAVVASLMATDAWPRVARAVVRWGIREARPALLAQGYIRAECRTMEGHADAIRLLERLGFIAECRVPNFGAGGAAFLQYAWRLDDHVPVQDAQAPPPPPPPPTPASKQEEEMNERKRLAKRKGFNTLTPFAIGDGMFANPTMQKTLLGG